MKAVSFSTLFLLRLLLLPLQGTSTCVDPPFRDSILDWNLIAIQVARVDTTFAVPDKNGPTKASRALAIIHSAMFDALNSIKRTAIPYLTYIYSPTASIDSGKLFHNSILGIESLIAMLAVAKAAATTLIALYPQQQKCINELFDAYLLPLSHCSGERNPVDLGIALGTAVAEAILTARADDGSNIDDTYIPIELPGYITLSNNIRENKRCQRAAEYMRACLFRLS